MSRLVIDGYNLLPITMASSRDELVLFLQRYKKTSPHDITVVFDGTHQGTGRGDHYFEGSVELIFTPLTVTADDHIEEMVESPRASGMIVVSSDRRIQRAAQAKNIAFITSQDFARTLLKHSQKPTAAKPQTQLQEYVRYDDGETNHRKDKRGNPKKLSKKERARRRTLGKL